jgi:regulator of replication initiation timing
MSLYDQSDATNTSDLQLREENMALRMEILKLKKALYLKSTATPEYNEASSR